MSTNGCEGLTRSAAVACAALLDGVLNEGMHGAIQHFASIANAMATTFVAHFNTTTPAVRAFIPTLFANPARLLFSTSRGYGTG